jgi:hypothetical protein
MRVVVNSKNIKINAFVFGHYVHRGEDKGQIGSANAMNQYGQLSV